MLIRLLTRIVCLSAFVWLSSFMPAAAAEAEGPLRLRVLSYNIHHAEGIDRKLDLQRIAEVIKSVKPDIVALQEVDQNVMRSDKVDQPAELARLTDMQSAFGGNIKLQGGGYGNALLTRFEIKRHENHLLPVVGQGEQRGVLEAELEVPGLKQPLRFLATHLDHRPNDAERLASVKLINELFALAPTAPAMLAGDLNDSPDSKTLEALEKHWTPTTHKASPTFPSQKPTTQIDFILYRPGERWKVIETKALDEAVASDHRAIFAVIELLPAD